MAGEFAEVQTLHVGPETTDRIIQRDPQVFAELMELAVGECVVLGFTPHYPKGDRTLAAGGASYGDTHMPVKRRIAYTLSRLPIIGKFPKINDKIGVNRLDIFRINQFVDADGLVMLDRLPL